jgi:hypothetical protein
MSAFRLAEFRRRDCSGILKNVSHAESRDGANSLPASDGNEATEDRIRRDRSRNHHQRQGCYASTTTKPSASMEPPTEIAGMNCLDRVVCVVTGRPFNEYQTWRGAEQVVRF